MIFQICYSRAGRNGLFMLEVSIVSYEAKDRISRLKIWTCRRMALDRIFLLVLDIHLLCVWKNFLWKKERFDSAGYRTQDLSIASQILYHLSYGGSTQLFAQNNFFFLYHFSRLCRSLEECEFRIHLQGECVNLPWAFCTKLAIPKVRYEWVIMPEWQDPLPQLFREIEFWKLRF